MQLDQFQKLAIAKVLGDLRGPSRSALLVAPTGAGKTVMMATTIKAEMLRRRQRVLIVQHTTPLFSQNLTEVQKVCSGLRFAALGAGKTSRGIGTADVTVATIQSAQGDIMDHLAPFNLIVIDEAHHAPAATYRALIKSQRTRNTDLAVLGLTATPARADGQGIDFLFPRISYQVTFEDVLRAGRVVPPRVLAADLGAVSAALGAHAWSDGDDAEASRMLRVEVTMDEIVRQHMTHAAGLRSVYFCCDTDHAEAMAASFAGAGLRSAAVSYRTPKGKLKALLADFAAGKYDVVTNPLMLTEGFNDPGIGCVGLARGFGAKELMVQAVGRGLRAHPGKREGLVLDFVRAADRHGDLFPRMDIASRVKRGGVAAARVEREESEIIPADHVLMAEIDMLGGLLEKVEIAADEAVSQPVAQNGTAPMVMSRAEAMALGLPKYFIGRPCKNGHLAERYINGDCCACRKMPEYKAKVAASRSSPEYKAKIRALKASPEYKIKARQRARLQRSTPEGRAKRVAWASARYYRKKHEPEFKAKRAALHASYYRKSTRTITHRLSDDG